MKPTRATALALLLTGAMSAWTHAVTPIPPAGSTTPRFTYSVTRVYPHDPQAFTQGIEFHDGVLYESTGLNGRSSVREVDLATGKVLREAPLDAAYFGEGITIWQSRLLQLTWRSEIGFAYDPQTFRPIGTFRYAGEGWGLTHDESAVIMSDGSASLRFLDPATLQEKRRLPVTDAGVPIANLNELEYVKGEILANVWQTEFVARISPSTGRVTGWVDLSGLLTPSERARTDVLNGIAYDAASRRLFVTGKLWPKLFEITLHPAAPRR